MRLLPLLAVLGTVIFSTTPSYSQEYPTRPVKLIVPYAPGAAGDPLGRLIGDYLAKTLGEPWVIENRAGAGGNIGISEVAHATPDGYTALLVSSGTLTINNSLYKNLGFDPMRDLVPVGVIAADVVVLGATNAFPANDVPGTIALLKSKPGLFNYGSGGVGTTGQLAMELFKTDTQTDIVHIQYKGPGAAIPALASGEVSLMITSAAGLMPLAHSGMIKALAVTSATRSTQFPDLPTIQESGVPGYEVGQWYGLFMPSKTPEPILKKLNDSFAAFMRLPETKEKILALGLTPDPLSRDEAIDSLQTDSAKWASVIKRAGIQPQ